MFSFENIYQAYKTCLKHKSNTQNALNFQVDILQNLHTLSEELTQRRYTIGKSICFLARSPKLREVFAANFRDRVVHHVLVNALEEFYEKKFIYDVYNNRKNKGIHKASKRAKSFMNAYKDGYYLQLDIKGFFYNLDKNILFKTIYEDINKKLTKRFDLPIGSEALASPNKPQNSGLLVRLKPHFLSSKHTFYKKCKITSFSVRLKSFYKNYVSYWGLDFSPRGKALNLGSITGAKDPSPKKFLAITQSKSQKEKAFERYKKDLLWLSNIIIYHNVTKDFHFKGDIKALQNLPEHKTLLKRPKHIGLPIGNITSQFFANVYMNRFDHFVKRELKCKHYIRYVDDFVIFDKSKERLLHVKKHIQDYLRENLLLELREDSKLKPNKAGLDFLGYIIKPTHTLVRKRVVNNFKYKKAKFLDKYENQKGKMPLEEIKEFLSVQASFVAHSKWANSYRLNSNLGVKDEKYLYYFNTLWAK